MAAGRIASAESRLTYAELAFDEKEFNIAAELAVTAGINLSDAICCLGSGEYVQGGAHDEAVDLLAGIDKEAANALRRLLALRTEATYGSAIGSQVAKQALRNARRMMDLARQRLES